MSSEANGDQFLVSLPLVCGLAGGSSEVTGVGCAPPPPEGAVSTQWCPRCKLTSKSQVPRCAPGQCCPRKGREPTEAGVTAQAVRLTQADRLQPVKRLLTWAPAPTDLLLWWSPSCSRKHIRDHSGAVSWDVCTQGHRGSAGAAPEESPKAGGKLRGPLGARGHCGRRTGWFPFCSPSQACSSDWPRGENDNFQCNWQRLEAFLGPYAVDRENRLRLPNSPPSKVCSVFAESDGMGSLRRPLGQTSLG